MGIEELVSPERVSLDEEAKAIYGAMRDSEMDFIDTLKSEFGARVWRQKWFEDEDGQVFSEDLEGGKRRFIALVPDRHGADLQAAWPALLHDLQPARDAMLATVKELASTQGIHRPGAGAQSTSLPILVPGLVERVTYTVNQAFRAGTITMDEIDLLLMRRERLLHQYIDVAENARQWERVEDYEQRLEELREDTELFEKLKNQHRLIGRVMSGTGTRVCFKRGAGDSTQHSLQHIAVAVADDGCEVERAPRRQRESKFGEPLATLGENLLVYAAP